MKEEDASFSLIDFIKLGLDVTEDNAPQIVEALLTERLFRYKEIPLVSKWLFELPAYQKEILFESDDLYEALDVFDGRNYSFPKPDMARETEKLTSWMHKFMMAKMPPNLAKWVVLNFSFPRIMLPSNAYLYVSREDFFSFLEKSVQEYPHIIDELKALKQSMSEGVNIVPDNGCFIRGQALGTTIYKTKAIQVFRDIFDSATLETVLHELGHIERNRLFQKFNRDFVPLVQYIDEAEQFAKSFYADSLVKEDFPFRALTYLIKSRVRKKYPTFSPMVVERLTAIRAKEVFSALILMDKNTRNEVILTFEKKGYLTKKESQKLMQEFFDIYDYYPKNYSFYNSAFYQKEVLKRIYFKRYKTPELLIEVLGDKRAHLAILSDDFLTELNQRCAFVDTERNDVSLLNLNTLYLGQKMASLILKDKTKEEVEEILNFYEDYDVYFKPSPVEEKMFNIEDGDMTDKLKCMVLNDFYRAPVKNVSRYVKVDYQFVDDVLLLKGCIRKGEKAPFFEGKDFLLVKESVLKKTPFSYLCLEGKTYLGGELDYITSSRYLKEVQTRFKARALPLKTILNDEEGGKKSLYLFQKNVTKEDVHSYLMLLSSAQDVRQRVSSFFKVEKERFMQNQDDELLPSTFKQKQSRSQR